MSEKIIKTNVSVTKLKIVAPNASPSYRAISNTNTDSAVRVYNNMPRTVALQIRVPKDKTYYIAHANLDPQEVADLIAALQAAQKEAA